MSSTVAEMGTSRPSPFFDLRTLNVPRPAFTSPHVEQACLGDPQPAGRQQPHHRRIPSAGSSKGSDLRHRQVGRISLDCPAGTQP